ncbi:unnamed protein product [Allacma fusca]|uniref:Retinol dehydrogenase 13 n=1 Tax=Allacma fusca TaxID=39272 RepID=A0A8J2L4Q7_9HEXA|nr:unnamed protein product [Allacma fusca]
MGWRLPKPFLIASAVSTVVGGIVILKDVISGADLKLDPKLKAHGKTVIVTGSNTGIGKETARGLAKYGATVYMACRDLTLCEKAREEIVLDTKNSKVYCRHCDLADFDSVRKFAEEFKKEEGKLNILINNAGIMRCPRMLTKQGIEMQLGVNHMGHFLLTNLLLEPLKAAAPSRIVVLSSLAHTRGTINFEDLNSEKSYDPGDAYSQSKLANVLFTKELAKRLQGTGVTVNAVHPGLVVTELARHMDISKSTMAKIFVQPIFKFVLKTPTQGSYTSLYVALDPSLDSTTGKYFSDSAEKDTAPAAEDPETALRLWLTSEKWTKLVYSTTSSKVAGEDERFQESNIATYLKKRTRTPCRWDFVVAVVERRGSSYGYCTSPAIVCSFCDNNSFRTTFLLHSAPPTLWHVGFIGCDVLELLRLTKYLWYLCLFAGMDF